MLAGTRLFRGSFFKAADEVDIKASRGRAIKSSGSSPGVYVGTGMVKLEMNWLRSKAKGSTWVPVVWDRSEEDKLEFGLWGGATGNSR